MEEQHVTGCEFDWNFLLDKNLVLGEIGPKEQLFIELLRAIAKPMGAGDDPQATVLGPFVSQCHPQADQIGPGKGPIPNILMPQSVAAEARLLRHYTIVVRHREVNPLAVEHLLQAACDGGLGDEIGEDRVARQGLLETTNRSPPFGIKRSR